MKVKILFAILGMAIMIVLTGCGRSVETQLIEVQSLHVSPLDVEVPINSDLQFYCIAVDKNGNPQKVNAEWTAYGSVGTIDARGLFKSTTRAGAGAVYAKYGAYQAYSFLEVKPGSLVSITISPSSETLGVGDSCSFVAVGKDTYGNDVDISPTWSVEGGIGTISDSYYDFSAKGVRYMSAYYSAYAYFTTSAAGTGTIKARCGDIEGSASVNIISFTPYTYVTQWSTKMGSETAIPKGVEIGPDGNVWVTMYKYSYDGDSYVYSGNITKYDSSGNLVLTLEAAASGEGKLEMPNDLAFDSLGNIYIVDFEGNKVKKYDSAGNYLLSWGGSGSSAGKFYSPSRIAIDKDDYLYVVDNGNDRIQKFDTSGNFILDWGGYGDDPGEFSYPTGIAVDSSGNIYVADQYNYRIQKFTGSGAFLASWGSAGTGVGELGEIVGMDTGSDGNLFIADYGNNRILKYDGSGNLLTRWGQYGSTAGKFSGAMDVAVDGSGNVYVADVYNGRIQKFRP